MPSYGGGSQELLMLRQLLGQFSPNYAQVAMLAGLLLVVIYRPERIQLLGMFRTSCVLLAISIVLPSLVGAIVGIICVRHVGNVSQLVGFHVFVHVDERSWNPGSSLQASASESFPCCLRFNRPRGRDRAASGRFLTGRIAGP